MLSTHNLLLKNNQILRNLTKKFHRTNLFLNKSDVSTSQTNAKIPDVPGLSAKVIRQDVNPAGPGASKSGDYKNPEYFSYHKTSYFDAEIEMSKYRCPQPSAKM